MNWLVAALTLGTWLLACSTRDAAPTASSGSGGAGGAGGEAPLPPAGFERWCAGKNWPSTLAPATVGKLHGSYLGVLQSSSLVAGAIEGQKFVPEHPFQVTRVRVAFGGKPGKARLRLTQSYGRSFPWPWPNVSDTSQDLMVPVEIEVTDPDPENWIEIDLAAPAYLAPTQHYLLIHEHLAPDPRLAVEGVAAAEREPERDYSRAGVYFPKTKDGGGVGGTAEVPSVNYRVELVGNTFCQLSDSERWFAVRPAPFTADISPYFAIVDFDGDGHDDLVDYRAGEGAVGYRGDGKGNFEAAAMDRFAAAPMATMLVFGDVDNDGDRDALAATWVGPDNDNDGYDVISEGDCNDLPGKGESIHPGAQEIPDNGKDDDCDGIADDGTSTSDADKDGSSIAQGDCDDTEPQSFPGNVELFDKLDNDCDRKVDETFTQRILLNDGTGKFSALENAGVEVISPATAGAFGDADADGNLDVYWGNWLENYPEDLAVQDNLYRGHNNNTFENAFESAGLKLPVAWAAFGVIWSDYDDDADHNILVTNYHLSANQLWQNQGKGTFIDVGEETGVAFDDVPAPFNVSYQGGHSYGADFGDLDGDGDFDFYLTNLSHPRFMPWSDPSQLLYSNGAPDFTFAKSQLEAKGMIYDEGDVNVAFADFDNDGDLDVAIASLYESHFSRLYRNDGETFTDVSYEANAAVRDAVSVSWSDSDEDGDLDLFLADRGGDPWLHHLENKVGQDNAWIELELVGTKSTRDAVGARATITVGGKQQMREVRAGGGHGNPQQTHWLHFGLGSATAIDALEIRWLGGAKEIVTAVAPRGRYRIVEGSGKAELLSRP